MRGLLLSAGRGEITTERCGRTVCRLTQGQFAITVSELAESRGRTGFDSAPGHQIPEGPSMRGLLLSAGRGKSPPSGVVERLVASLKVSSRSPFPGWLKVVGELGSIPPLATRYPK